MILATDLDGTFLAGDAATRHRLYQLVSLHADVDLIFVTGRGLESVLPLLSDPTIPQPKYIICDVGATVVEGATLQPVQPLQSDIEQRWPGEHAIERIMSEYPQFSRQDVPQQRRCSYFCEPGAISVMPTPPNFTARACAFRRVPSQLGQASSVRSSTSGSAKLCSRPRSLSSRTESSSALRCSRESARPVPTQSGHQPCLLLYENRRGSSSG